MSEHIERWLEMQNPKLQKSITVVENTRPLLHLSANQNIRTFTPRIPKSLYDGEDQTVPRVCVSANLIDTLIGASWNFEELQNQANFDSLDYTVYSLDVEQSIRPTKKLTQEGIATGELWIVPYRMSMYEVSPSRAASLSITNIRLSGATVSFDVVMEVREEMLLVRNTKLAEGYYRLRKLKLSDILGKNRDMQYNLDVLSRDDYLKAKSCLITIR